jgi:hypothetical protein
LTAFSWREETTKALLFADAISAKPMPADFPQTDSLV